MSEKNTQTQIDEINRKLDLVLEEIYLQKQSRETINDLIDDVSIVGTDVFKNTVIQLDNAGVELDTDALGGLGIKLIRNITALNDLMELLESSRDFIADATPIMHQVGLDAIHKMNELEQKGYIDFIKELMSIMDNIVNHFSVDDVRALSDNIVTILETVKNLTQPDMLKAIDNAVNIFKNLETTDVPEYSVWQMMREFRSPEMKRAMGIMMTFMKNLAKEENQKSEK